MVIAFEVIRKASVAFLQKIIYIVIDRRITPLSIYALSDLGDWFAISG